MGFVEKLKLLFLKDPVFDELVKELRKRRRDQEVEDNKHRLRLCYKHRQERNHSHYSEKNCDYCRAIKALDKPSPEEH